MQLFTAEQVKQRESTSERERAERIARLNHEESLAVRMLNETTLRAKQETNRLLRELETFSANVESKKLLLSREIAALEERKKEALKPIKELRADAERALAEARAFDAELQKENSLLRARHEELSELAENLADKEADLQEREVAIAQKELNLATETKFLKESGTKLSKKWSKFHAEILEANKVLVAQEKMIENDARINKELKKSLDEESKRLKMERLALQDAYKTLEKAKKEIYGQRI